MKIGRLKVMKNYKRTGHEIMLYFGRKKSNTIFPLFNGMDMERNTITALIFRIF